MKTRVSKNKELHQNIVSDTESVVESSDLSHFANRLNKIDDQFNRMNVEKQDDRVLEHARQNDVALEDALDEDISVSDSQFDTFESAYLKDFLQEVKDYNVKKGYRDDENTSTNIMKDLKLEVDDKAREISQEDLGFVKPNDLENLESVLSEIDEEQTQIYKAVDHTSREDYVPARSLDETIAMAVMSMSEDETFEDDLKPEEDFTDMGSDFEPYVDVESDEFSPEFFEAPEKEAEAIHHDSFTRELLEQTQTLQFKVVNQEKSLEEMGDTMVRTNRLLNGVLSLLMLAIIVVLMFIVSNIWKG